MTEGIQETVNRVESGNLQTPLGEYNNLGTKFAKMLDTDPATARCMSTLGGLVGGMAVCDLMGGALNTLAGAGNVLSIGNANLSGGLSDSLAANFGAGPQITGQFGPDGAAAPAPAATPAPNAAPTNTMAPGTIPGAAPGFSPSGMG